MEKKLRKIKSVEGLFCSTIARIAESVEWNTFFWHSSVEGYCRKTNTEKKTAYEPQVRRWLPKVTIKRQVKTLDENIAL